MQNPTEKRLIWDLLTRILHWSLALSVISGWALGRFGPTILTYHYYLGYLVGAVILVRLYWGLRGPRPVRFSSFLFGPRTTLTYLKTLAARRPSNWPGHNPLGGWSVFALLAVLIAQVVTGLIADPDDFVNIGPLAGLVDFDTARWAARTHRILSNLLVVLVGLHLAAILFYRIWKRENLVKPMVTGWKEVRRDHDAP